MSTKTHFLILLLAFSLLKVSSPTMTGEDLEVEQSVFDEPEATVEYFNRLNNTPRNARRIFIDPGHGGSDPGASGNGVVESHKNLEIALKVGAILQGKGYAVNYSRTNNAYVSLSDRAYLANVWGADLFVSIHANSFTGSDAYGTETYLHPYGGPVSLDYATRINNALVNHLGLHNRGVKTADFAVLRDTSMPAVLVETAFVSNPSDAEKLRNNPQGFANAIASAF